MLLKMIQMFVSINVEVNIFLNVQFVSSFSLMLILENNLIF